MSNVITNIGTRLREAFESDPVIAGRWDLSCDANDFATIDGNAAAKSYLVISKSPLHPGTATIFTAREKMSIPMELSIACAMSQRTLGQEVAIEFVDTLDPIANQTDVVAITSIQQATTTLSITTNGPHGYSVGSRFGVNGVTQNSALNYPSLVVASTPTSNTLTATAGPMGAIPSLSVGPFASGVIYRRATFAAAQNGANMIFEQASATGASFFVRSEAGEMAPSGTIIGNQTGPAIASTAAVQAINAANVYAFTATTIFNLVMQTDRLQWTDRTLNSITQLNSRYNFDEVIPDPRHFYHFRIRALNNAALTVPNAKIVSAVKAGSTTATINTDVAHGLTTGDVVVVYGIRDQAATSFPNLLTATAVASTPTTTSLTLVQGTSGTVTSYGGLIARVNGGNLPSALGYSAVVVSTVNRTNNILTVVGNASWTGLLIGDYVNLHGVRVDLTGADLGVDGAYKVADVVTTTLTLVPITGQIQGCEARSPTGANIATTNCGGAVIKRTDFRAPFVRLFDYERERVEIMPRPAGDLASVPSVVVNGGTLAIGSGTITTVSTVTAVTTAGQPPVPATPYFLNSAASTNGALILTGTSAVTSFHATNIGAAVAFVKLYNKATAPTVGTDVPEMIITVPAAVGGVPGTASLPGGYQGYRFPLGLGIAITGLVADTDTTAVTAGQVKVKLNRAV